MSLYDLQLKTLLIYFLLALYAAPQSSLCLKQAVLDSACESFLKGGLKKVASLHAGQQVK